MKQATEKKTATKKQPAKKNSVKTSPAATGAGTDDSMLKEFFIEELKDIYWAEKHLVKFLPKMAKAAVAEELEEAFLNHTDVTKTHVIRLENVFSLLDQKAVAKKCDAMEGITKEGESIVEETEADTATRDVGLILAAQKVEHYEIATYGGLTQLAQTLGLTEVVELLAETLNEEKQADMELTFIAENGINYEAVLEEE